MQLNGYYNVQHNILDVRLNVGSLSTRVRTCPVTQWDETCDVGVPV